VGVASFAKKVTMRAKISLRSVAAPSEIDPNAPVEGIVMDAVVVMRPACAGGIHTSNA
jgi:hypothetical protein